MLHTWNQELSYHVHMHCIISGCGLTCDWNIRQSNSHFFIPVYVLRDKFKGKYLACLDSYYKGGKLTFSSSCEHLKNAYHWQEWKDGLCRKGWCHYIKETFNGFGNAIEYLGRYTHKIAISNNQMKSKNLKIIFTLQGQQRFKRRYTGLTIAELLKAVWNFDIRICPDCGHATMKQLRKVYGSFW